MKQLKPAQEQEKGPITNKDGNREQRTKAMESGSGPVAVRLAAQEEFVALVYLQYIHVVLLQIREGLLTAAVCFLLVSVSLSVYPFLNRHAAAHALVLVFAFLAVAAVTVFFQINRDPILSRITDTEPGKLDFDFVGKVFGTVSVPLAGLALTFFPQVSGYFLSLLSKGK